MHAHAHQKDCKLLWQRLLVPKGRLALRLPHGHCEPHERLPERIGMLCGAPAIRDSDERQLAAGKGLVAARQLLQLIGRVKRIGVREL